MNHLLRRRFSEIHGDIWSSYLNALLGTIIIACCQNITNRIIKDIVISQRLVDALLGLFIFAQPNNIADRINIGIIAFRIKCIGGR
jgi:hypothetical protein